jgi:hypothetical protein
MKAKNNRQYRFIRIKEDTYQRVRGFGEFGEPIDQAVFRAVELAEKHKDELMVQEVRA